MTRKTILQINEEEGQWIEEYYLLFVSDDPKHTNTIIVDGAATLDITPTQFQKVLDLRGITYERALSAKASEEKRAKSKRPANGSNDFDKIIKIFGFIGMVILAFSINHCATQPAPGSGSRIQNGADALCRVVKCE